jgi:cell division protein FtsQ
MAATAARPAPLPADIRLMNAVAYAIFALAALALLAAALNWVGRQPLFALRTVTVDGELTRNVEPALRSAVGPRLGGTFFSVDLAAVRGAFESVPWVRQAVVRRIWPDRLRVTLVEHRAVALWVGEGDERLVNDHGEVFEANVGDVEDEGLPRFEGPPGQAARMLAMYRELSPVMAALPARIELLRLSRRGSWRVELDDGAAVELGRGGAPADETAEVLARAQRFVRTVGQVTTHYQRRLLHADLRHPDGYAVRLEGITTTMDVAPKPATR